MTRALAVDEAKYGVRVNRYSEPCCLSNVIFIELDCVIRKQERILTEISLHNRRIREKIFHSSARPRRVVFFIGTTKTHEALVRQDE